MKFELKLFNRNVADDDFLKDLRHVASDLQKDSLSVEEYNKHGKYHPSTIQRRFGSWQKALSLANLQIRKHPTLTESELLEDLKEIAKNLNKQRVTAEEYRSLGKYAIDPFKRVFGSWAKALEKAGLEKTKTTGIKDEEYFENIEDVWIKLGRQPKYIEMQKPLSKYSAGAYEYRFGTWRTALEAFIKYINKGDNISIDQREKVESLPEQINTEVQKIKHKTKRNISSRLKVRVLMRDGNKCKLCGVTVTGENIHFDHIKPWSKGGETVLENIQVLCAEHNIAKSNLE